MKIVGLLMPYPPVWANVGVSIRWPQELDKTKGRVVGRLWRICDWEGTSHDFLDPFGRWITRARNDGI